jgi:7-cyano-7-deazaguanine synthase
MTASAATEAIAVLVSGGVDSAVLTMELADSRTEVHPVYVRHGLIWEDSELDHLRAFLRAAAKSAVQGLTILDLPVADLYASHWAMTGRGVPDSDTPDEAVYLPGRNLMLLAKMAVFCERRGIHDIALAPLQCNPFADNTDEFYETMQAAAERALGWPLRILRPYASLKKSQVVLGPGSSAALTLPHAAGAGTALRYLQQRRAHPRLRGSGCGRRDAVCVPG